MEPIGLCGGGLAAVGLLCVAVVGAAVVAGGIALALARLGVLVDSLVKKGAGPPHDESGHSNSHQDRTPEDR